MVRATAACEDNAEEAEPLWMCTHSMDLELCHFGALRVPKAAAGMEVLLEEVRK